MNSNKPNTFRDFNNLHYSPVYIYGFFIMNSSELDSEWPDNYEVEITESHRMSDSSFNETNNNGTLNFQGK